MPSGPTGLPPWPDCLARLTRLPVASIALIRGRATGNGSEIALACDISFASREKAIISQWEVGVGMVAGGGPMARLPQLIGRNRAPRCSWVRRTSEESSRCVHCVARPTGRPGWDQSGDSGEAER